MGRQFIAVILLLAVFNVCTMYGTDIKLPETDDPVLKFADSEINKFITPDFLKNSGFKQVAFSFQKEPNLQESAFSVESSEKDGLLNVILAGRTSSDILCALYTFLEQGGYLFEITGPLYPEQFDWSAVKNYSKKVVPSVIKRGIRQHINFPMDLSSWSRDDALEYIRNLARMRFNAMTFHSYPGQWYEVKRKDKTDYAGHFFYGDVHFVPDYLPIKKIAVNKKYFCIPEIEPVFEDEAARSRAAVEWLAALMNEAKRTGMKVQFSFEPRGTSTDVTESVETVKAVLREYPMIDSLEFMTEEFGGWGKTMDKKETLKVLRDFYGKEFAEDKTLTTFPKNPRRPALSAARSNLGTIYMQLGHNIKLIKYLKEHKITPDKLQLKLGLYSVIPGNTRPAFYLARKVMPDTEIEILPAHHSHKVAINAGKALLTPSDWANTAIYSWIEFDGMMFLQQNASSGISALLKQYTSVSPSHRAEAVLFNHWRTAENKVTAKFAAEASLNAALTPQEFYKWYAGKYGIENREAFSAAMSALDRADITALNKIRGIGFCWVGRWRNPAIIASSSPDKLKSARAAYENAEKLLASAFRREMPEKGKCLLRFLDNRIRTTLLFIKAFENGTAAKKFIRIKKLSEAEHGELETICNQGISILEQYIKLYAEENADRGCAGNLVSLWYGPVKAYKQLRKEKCGVPFNDPVPSETAVDAPPPPIDILPGDKEYQ